jgi:uncharacterized protein
MNDTNHKRIALFPLQGAVLFPRMHMPLHIFEPRYKALVKAALEQDGEIGLIQPSQHEEESGEKPALFTIGCLGKIVDHEKLDDGCYRLVLQGQARFKCVQELEVDTAFRQVEAELLPVHDEPEVLEVAGRAALEQASRDFARKIGVQVDWQGVSQLDDEALVNAIALIAPFDAAAKQALLEAPDIASRAEMIIQIMLFMAKHDGGTHVTLQ